MIQDQMRVLNDTFTGRTGGAKTLFSFELAGVTRTNNAAWFNGGYNQTSDDPCMSEFTRGQALRMRAAYVRFRQSQA